ncbi:hypothetical protein COCCADRAFT_94474, partial [Bipolaris zeicola 26-R-13]
FSALGMVNKNQPTMWLQAMSAVVITIHLETDVQQKKDVVDIIAAFAKLVNTMPPWSPKTKTVAAPIIAIESENYNSRVQGLNHAIGLNQIKSFLWVVGQYTSLDVNSKLREAVDPNHPGDAKAGD